MVASLLLLGGGALIVGGIVASGYLADTISNVLDSQGRNRQFSDVDDLSDELVQVGRYDLAVQLNRDVAFSNSPAFELQAQQQQGILGGLFGGDTAQLATIALLAYVLIKK